MRGFTGKPIPSPTQKNPKRTNQMQGITGKLNPGYYRKAKTNSNPIQNDHSKCGASLDKTKNPALLKNQRRLQPKAIQNAIPECRVLLENQKHVQPNTIQNAPFHCKVLLENQKHLQPKTI